MKRLRWIFIAIIVGLATRFPQATSAQNPRVEIGVAVTGNVGGTDAQSWVLVARDDGDLSVLVRRIDGDLDPRVGVYDDEGDPVAQNDDAINGVITDAAASFDANAGAEYTIVVRAFAGAGDYQLWVLPTDNRLIWDSDDFADGVGRWGSPYCRPEGQQLVYETGRLVDRSIVVGPTGRTPITDGYLHAEFTWRTTEPSTTFGLVLRTANNDLAPDAYYFNLSPTGSWSIERQQFAQATILAEGTLETLPPNLSIGAAIARDDLTLYVGGQQIETISDATFNSGGWGLHLRGEGAAAGVSIERVILTTPFFNPPNVPTQLANWRSARADDIAVELVEEDVIPANGRRVYTVLDTSYQIAGQNTRTYPQVEEGVTYGDMLLNVDVLPAEGSDVACGVVLRDSGEADRVVAYGGMNGDAGLIVVRNGVVLSHTYDILPPVDDPLSDGAMRLTLIVYGPFVVLYVNGHYFATQYGPPSTGELGVILLNYADNAGRCSFRNLWVWQ